MEEYVHRTLVPSLSAINKQEHNYGIIKWIITIYLYIVVTKVQQLSIFCVRHILNIYFYFYKCGHRNVLSKRQVWISILHIINLKKKLLDTGSWIFLNKKTNPGLLILLKIRSCVFISNFHHSPPPPPFI